MDLILGIDIGTSSVKAGLFNLDGKVLAAARAPHPVYSPQPGWFEQDPRDWWLGVKKTLAEVLQGVDPGRVISIGLSGQCPGHVLVDSDGVPLGRAIIWRDQRAQVEAAWIAGHVSAEQAMTWTGSAEIASASLPPARHLWLKNHRVQEWGRARAVLQPKDFIGMSLTGWIGTDRSSAFCMVNPASGSYEAEYLEVLDIPASLMPEVYNEEAVLGEVSSRAASECGLRAGTPVVVGTIDAWCENIAGGILQEGRAVDIAGTSEIVSLNASQAAEAQGVYLAKLGEGCQFYCGPTQAGGDTLRWLGQGFFPGGAGAVSYQDLQEKAAQAPAGSEGLVFLPYLSGERAPVWDSHVRGGFIGLALQHDLRHLTRAVYEGVAFAVRHILEACEQAAGYKAELVAVCGGGSRSLFWNQIKADILQRPLQAAAHQETACLGAAVIACTAVGAYASLEEASRRMIALASPILPDPEHAGRYEENYGLYKTYYPAMKEAYSVFKPTVEER
jgi:xylulokinase